MDLKEVCSRTNLTEQTIKIFVEYRLITPEIATVNGEMHLSFTEENIQQLIKIAALTRWDFSVDHIIELHHHPNQINNILSQHLKVLSQNTDQRIDVIKTIERIQLEEITDVYHLVERLSAEVSRTPLSEIATKYKFSRFESETPEEKELAYEKFVAAQKVREKIQKIVKPIKIGVIVLIGIAILARIVILISGIPHKIDKELTAVQFRMNDETLVEHTTITIKGKLYKQWFTDYRFEGSFIVNNYEYSKIGNLVEIVFNKEILDSMGSLTYTSYIDREHKMETFATIKMTDDFENVLLRIFEPIGNDIKAADDLWIAAPANSREEAILIWEEMKY